ncbi:uncharacterized protein LOC122502365 [Leptopilina heterotoma]|uniref:uncharacterized protein LOC122502365 n=1 Tax=Leptopilina heterotoma TaxID=63436 RepID=UPI001CA93640|nr:uncharacterized protein LOC122502365 [Leptopilina heterotoma]
MCGNDEDQKKISKDDTNRMLAKPSEKIEESETEVSYAKIQEKFDSLLEGMEKMMSVTIALHSKMQENIKLWFKQRELDEERAKKIKITSDVALSPSEKIPLMKAINENQVPKQTE